MIKLPKKVQPQMMKKHTQKRITGLGDQTASTRRYATYRRLRAQMSPNTRRTLAQLLFVGNGFAQELTLTLTLAVLALSQPTRDETWHHLILIFSLFFNFCFLTMIPSLLLVPSSLTIHTRQYFEDKHSTRAMPRNITELVQ